MVSRKHAANPRTIKHWADIQRQRPVARATLVKQLLAAAHFALPDNGHGTPGLVLTSDHDGVVSRRCSEAIARRYGWALHCHRGAGHDLPLDDPEWVVERIGQWLAMKDQFEQ